MMIKIQILKKDNAGTFLLNRKVFVLLFLFFFHLLSAHIAIGNENSLIPDEELIAVSDSVSSQQEESPNANIYVTSGATIVNLDQLGDVKIVNIESPVPAVKEKLIAKKTTPKKVFVPIDRKVYQKQLPIDKLTFFHPSSKTNLSYSSSESQTIAVVPSQISHSKIILKPTPNNWSLVISEFSEDKILCFYKKDLTSVHQILSSGRAPPVSA